MSHHREPTTCNHEWIEDFDPVEDAAAYNDGFNYFPTHQVCTKCGKKERIRQETLSSGGCILLFPAILVGTLAVGVLAQFVWDG